jgi:hypothetical protein
MTISSTTVKNSYNGDGSTATFTYTFKIFANSDLQVIIRSALGTETVKTLTTHYTVTGAGSASGGDITFTAGNIPASGETVVLRRAIPQTQAIDYIANDPFPAESHEEGLDRATMAIQQLQEEVDRAIKLSRTNTITSSEFTVGAANRANKVLAFDASGELSVAQELGQFQGNWSAGETFAQRDLVKDTSNNNIYICLTAHTSSGSLPISSNADVAKWSLIVDAASATASAAAAASSATDAETAQTAAEAAQAAAELAETNAETAETNAETAQTAAETAQTAAELAESNAQTSETNAANSATSASGSATTATTQAGIATTQASNASTSASNAATSESNASSSASAASTSASNAATSATNASNSASAASTSASNAATSATNASNAQTAAETAQAAAELAYDNFDDRYLGPKASDPSTDNDGDALIDGALYFNTTGNVLKYWDGSAWQNVEATDTSSFATNGFAIAMAIAL